MLRRYGKALAHSLPGDVFFLDQRRLLHDLTRIAQKLHALGREEDAPALAHEDRRIDLLLQIMNRRRQARLGDEQRFCRLGDRSLFRDLDDVFELLKRHKRSSRYVLDIL